MTDRGLILRNTYPMIRTVSQNNNFILVMIFELKCGIRYDQKQILMYLIVQSKLEGSKKNDAMLELVIKALETKATINIPFIGKISFQP